jgi:hypothetical protein
MQCCRIEVPFFSLRLVKGAQPAPIAVDCGAQFSNIGDKNLWSPGWAGARILQKYKLTKNLQNYWTQKGPT